MRNSVRFNLGSDMSNAILLAASTCSQATPPVGGFRRITTRQICAVWSAYRSKVLATFLDVRVYFALHEIAERRATACRVARRKTGRVRVPHFKRETVVGEIRHLVGTASVGRIRASMRRLEQGDLVRITATEIRFAELGVDGRASGAEQVDGMLARIHHRVSVRERSVPIPRRTLRFLAANGRPTLTATMLGQMTRCLWWNEGRCDSVGSCSTGFVANVFDVHERNVKRARVELRRIGWLTEVPTAPWHVNIHGARVTIDLAWRETKAGSEFLSCEGVISKSPPPTPACVSKSPPPIDKHNLPSGSKNHNPGSARSIGVRKRTENPGKPVLRRVVPEDLRNASRLALLFSEAVQGGLVQESPADRLRFFAAAEHALRIGKQNRCGLFAAVVRRGLWRFISQADEDRAMTALNQFASPEEPVSANATTRRMPTRCGGELVGTTVDGGDFVSGLVRELVRLRSFDGGTRAVRNRAPCDDVAVDAA